MRINQYKKESLGFVFDFFKHIYVYNTLFLHKTMSFFDEPITIDSIITRQKIQLRLLRISLGLHSVVFYTFICIHFHILLATNQVRLLKNEKAKSWIYANINLHIHTLIISPRKLADIKLLELKFDGSIWHLAATQISEILRYKSSAMYLCDLK